MTPDRDVHQDTKSQLGHLDRQTRSFFSGSRGNGTRPTSRQEWTPSLVEDLDPDTRPTRRPLVVLSLPRKLSVIPTDY